jgi:hypothetical protein
VTFANVVSAVVVSDVAVDDDDVAFVVELVPAVVVVIVVHPQSINNMHNIIATTKPVDRINLFIFPNLLKYKSSFENSNGRIHSDLEWGDRTRHLHIFDRMNLNRIM